MPDTPTSPDIVGIQITDSAAKRIAVLKAAEDNDGLMLRVSVSGGGCSGFQYGFSLDSHTTDEDLVFEENGIQVVVDEVSLQLVQGSRLDYVEELIGSYFKLENPQASSSCGCGSSFSI